MIRIKPKLLSEEGFNKLKKLYSELSDDLLDADDRQFIKMSYEQYVKKYNK